MNADIFLLKFFASFLQKRRQQQVENLIGNEVDGLDNLTRQIYEDGYYQTIFELQKGTGVTSSFAILDADKIKKVLSKPWASDGLDFSRRVWGQHRAELVQKLNTDFVQALIRGDDSQKLINKISSDFNVSKYKAGRLVITESAFFATESQKDAFRELGVKYFSVSATFDRDTCSDCGYREGEKISMDLYEVGVTAPPFHPNCRCDIVPEDTYGDIKSYRAARDKNGNYVEVPNDMSYMQWKKKYIDNSDKNDIIEPKDVSSLEQAKKRNKKIYINDIAISKVPLVNIPELSEIQNQVIQQKHKDLLNLSMSKNNSNEVANVFKLDFSQEIFQFGTENVVELNKNPIAADIIIKSKKNSVFVMHNHPSSKKFSYSDLAVLLINDSVFAISVVSNTGEVHILSKLENYNQDIAINFLRDIRNKNTINNKLREEKVVDDFLKGCKRKNISYIMRGGKHGK